MLIGPCALTTAGAATVAALVAAAPFRKLRRVADFDVTDFALDMSVAPPRLAGVRAVLSINNRTSLVFRRMNRYFGWIAAVPQAACPYGEAFFHPGPGPGQTFAGISAGDRAKPGAIRDARSPPCPAYSQR